LFFDAHAQNVAEVVQDGKMRKTLVAGSVRAYVHLHICTN